MSDWAKKKYIIDYTDEKFKIPENHEPAETTRDRLRRWCEIASRAG
jgi:hypothetical protein